MRKSLNLRVVRRVIVGDNWSVWSLIVIPVIVIHGHATLDPNHLVDIEIGPVEKAKAGIDATEMVRDPLIGEFGLDADDTFVFSKEAG